MSRDFSLASFFLWSALYCRVSLQVSRHQTTGVSNAADGGVIVGLTLSPLFLHKLLPFVAVVVEVIGKTCQFSRGTDLKQDKEALHSVRSALIEMRLYPTRSEAASYLARWRTEGGGTNPYLKGYWSAALCYYAAIEI